MGHFASKLEDRIRMLGLELPKGPFSEVEGGLFEEETRIIGDLFLDLQSSTGFRAAFGPVETRLKECDGSKPGTRNRLLVLQADIVPLELKFLLETTDLGMKSSVRLRVWGSQRDLICTDGEIGVLARLVARVEDLIADKTAERLAATFPASKTKVVLDEIPSNRLSRQS